MNTSMKAIAAAVALAVSGTAHAASEVLEPDNSQPLGSTTGSNVLANIVKTVDGNEQAALLVNTGLTAVDLINGAVAEWSSNDVPGLTQDIADYVSGADGLQMWLVGGWAEPNIIDFGGSLFRVGTQSRNAIWSDNPITSNAGLQNAFTNTQAYFSAVNQNGNGFIDSPDDDTGLIPTGNTAHFTNNLVTLDNSAVGAGELSTLWLSSIEGGVVTNRKLGFATLDGATGELGYQVVPLPAGIWLLGAGLVGLMGLARRKTAA